MMRHPDSDYIYPLDIEVKEHLVYCSHVEVEPDGFPWYLHIKKYLQCGIYPVMDTFNNKKLIRYMVLNFLLSGEIFYRKTQDLGLL